MSIWRWRFLYLRHRQDEKKTESEACLPTLRAHGCCRVSSNYWHSVWIFLICHVYSGLPLCPQAWWITKTVSTDLWGKWELASTVWHYTDLKDYPEGESMLEGLELVILVFTFSPESCRNNDLMWLDLRLFGMEKQIQMFISMFEQVQLKVKLF